jgi:hypothetical protein
MFSTPVSFIVVASAVMVATAVAYGPSDARAADHKCDPVSDVGWTVVAAEETISQVDGAPFQAGTGGNWFIDRATTVLPFCHYYNAIGIYSMRSYSLAPRETTERIAICRGAAPGGSAAVAPYAGPCPPM